VWQNRVRGWQLIAGLVVIALVGVGVALYLTRNSRVDGPSLTSWFPARDATVVYLDVAAMRSSGILEKLVGSTMGEESEYRAFVQGTGFDYKRDLDQVMLNSANGVHYFVLQGRFDLTKLKNYAKSQGGACDGDYCHMKGSTPDRIISFRPLRGNLLALASSRDENGARAIDQRTPEKPAFEIPDTPVWAHVPADAVRDLPQYPAGTRLFAKALESAERAVFTLAPTKNELELAVNVTCQSEEAAAVLKAQLQGITELLQKLITRESQKPSAADLSGMLTSGSFERKDRHVLGRWPVSRALIDSLGKT
jgi:hypothetical protein